ncbi:MAG: HDOD domain-containing protein [Lachnospiraceae bacterium]|nr:HDOD domain-containing protein [Lachnospiraceae bacterium]
MLATLIPLFDEKMAVRAYSLFSQKDNFLLDPRYFSTGINDGVGRINGLEIIESMGIKTLSQDKEIFVPVNNISIFTDIASQCSAPHERIVLFVDNTVRPEEMYINRIKQLKEDGYKLAMCRLQVADFENYKPILLMMDYMLLNYKRIDISKARVYFKLVYPNIKLVAEDIQSMEDFEKLKSEEGYQFFEGDFYRVPITKGDTKVAPLKVNYIQLINMVNDDNFELTKAADIIGRDTALVISLLKIVNKMSRNSEITSIRHAAAMMGQKELRKWITTAVTRELCFDRPNEITRISLLRAKFAENLADCFGMRIQSQELFIMGLFSVLDLILNKPMSEALSLVNVSDKIRKALVEQEGDFASVLKFMIQYENANWQEVSRLLILSNIAMDDVYKAYISALEWYRDLFTED